jgi:pyruvate, water dikinase
MSPDQEIAGTLLVGSSTTRVHGLCNSTGAVVPDSILVTRRLGPESYDAIIASRAVICAQGGFTGHMQSLCRTRGIPVLRIPEEFLHLLEGEVTLDGSRPSVILGAVADVLPTTELGTVAVDSLGAICVVIADISDVRSVTAAVPPGSGLDSYFIREEFLSLARGLNPVEALTRGPEEAAAYGTAIGESLAAITAETPTDQRIIMRLLDLRSDDAAKIAADGTDVAVEPNPELGLHGARWLALSEHYPDAFRALSACVRERLGPDAHRVTYSVPFVNDADEYRAVRRRLGLPQNVPLSVFVETPAAVHATPGFCAAGVTEIFVGTKDLTQFYLAADRGNHTVASSYQTRHPAVMAGLEEVIRNNGDAGVPVFVFGLGADLEHYLSILPTPTGFMMCTAELIHLSIPTQRTGKISLAGEGVSSLGHHSDRAPDRRRVVEDPDSRPRRAS